jgi:hypothetical protein
MKKLVRLIFVSALVLFVSGTMIASAHAQPTASSGLASSTTAAKPAPKIPNVKLPCTFVCKHCGIKITVKTAADWLKPCPACPCGTSIAECYPTKGGK